MATILQNSEKKEKEKKAAVMVLHAFHLLLTLQSSSKASGAKHPMYTIEFRNRQL